MNRRTRLFVLGTSGVLLAGIATAGIASWAGIGNIGLMAANGSDELAYVPADAQLIAYVDVRHVMDSELRHRLQPDLGSNRAPSHLFEETGINIETDVDSVVIAGLGEGAPDGPPLVLARGRFNPSRIEAAFRSRGGSVSDYNGVKLIAAENGSLAVAFIKTDLLAVGSPDNLRGALDASVGASGTIKDNSEVMRLVDRVDDGDAWTVARFDALRGRAPVPADLASQLPSITWFAAGGQVSDSVSAVLHAETRDEQSAQDLREVIRGFVALVRMQAGQQQEFADFMNSVELSGDGTTVTLGFSVPSSLIDRLSTFRQRPSDAPPPAVLGL